MSSHPQSASQLENVHLLTRTRSMPNWTNSNELSSRDLDTSNEAKISDLSEQRLDELSGCFIVLSSIGSACFVKVKEANLVVESSQ